VRYCVSLLTLTSYLHASIRIINVTNNDCSGFGELALLYSCPRSATVTAMESGKLWVMERSMYQAIVQAFARRLEKRKREVLDSVPIFNFLSDVRL